MKIFRISLWLALIATIFLAACNRGDDRTGLDFEQAWVRPVPPGMKMTAGFGTLHNQGSKAISLTSFTSESFGDVSLHRTEKVDGVSRMREVGELLIEPGDRALLEPGGYHLMLMMPSEEVQPGMIVTVTISASDGRSFRFNVPVERR